MQALDAAGPGHAAQLMSWLLQMHAFAYIAAATLVSAPAWALASRTAATAPFSEYGGEGLKALRAVVTSVLATSDSTAYLRSSLLTRSNLYNFYYYLFDPELDGAVQLRARFAPGGGVPPGAMTALLRGLAHMRGWPRVEGNQLLALCGYPELRLPAPEAPMPAPAPAAAKRKANDATDGRGGDAAAAAGGGKRGKC